MGELTTNILLALAGGVLIGLASATMLLLLGRISGISGIIGMLLPPKTSSDWDWRLSFILGLLAGGGLLMLAAPSRIALSPGEPSSVLIVVAGLLVGFGTRLGSGCTSGHGICGNARLSSRSIVATLTFIGAGVVAVVIRSLGGF